MTMMFVEHPLASPWSANGLSVKSQKYSHISIDELVHMLNRIFKAYLVFPCYIIAVWTLPVVPLSSSGQCTEIKIFFQDMQT